MPAALPVTFKRPNVDDFRRPPVAEFRRPRPFGDQRVTTYVYLANSELPSIPLRWSNNDGTVIDLSAVTWSLKLVNSSGTTVLTKTTGITGYSSFQGTSPYNYNVLIAWTSGDLATSGVSGGTYTTYGGTFVLQYTSGSNQSEPYMGDLTVVVNAAPT